jgi:hypothetical protein
MCKYQVVNNYNVIERCDTYIGSGVLYPLHDLIHTLFEFRYLRNICHDMKM